MHKILLVLASEDLRLALVKILQKDYSVVACRDAAGVNLLQQQPDAMVLDLFLPDTDGLTFLKEHQPLLPPLVLALTPYLDQEIEQALHDAGVKHIFMKPCSFSAIVMRLAEHLT